MSKREKIWTVVSGIIIGLVIMFSTVYVNSIINKNKEYKTFKENTLTKIEIKALIKTSEDKCMAETKRVDDKVDANNKVVSTSLTEIKTSLRSIEVYMRKK